MTSSGEMAVSWSEAEGARKYLLQRRTHDGSAWSAWGTLNGKLAGTGYTDSSIPSGTVHVQYRVRAYRGAWSDYSARGTATFPPAAPELEAAYSGGGVDLSWNEVNGALRYAVFERNYVNGVWTAWKSISTRLSGTGYSDSAIPEGTTMCQYRMRSNNGTWSEYSNRVTVIIP